MPPTSANCREVDLPIPLPLTSQEATYLKCLLIEHGFTEASMQAVLEISPRGVEDSTVDVFDFLTRERTSRNTLLRLFALDLPVSTEAVESTIGREFLNTCLGHGLVSSRDGMVVPAVALSPINGLYVASDRRTILHDHSVPGKVLGLTGSTKTLYGLMPRRPCLRMLDLFAGGAVHGQAAAAQAEEVVAVDINARCAAFGRFSASLNGITNFLYVVEDAPHFRDCTGFDLIVANPPFFISPGQCNVYCENPMNMDDFSETVVRNASRLLRADGVCLVTSDWAETAHEGWQSRLLRWFSASGCNAVVLKDSSMTPESYALSRTRQTTRPPDVNHGELCREWIEYYRRCGIVRLHSGVIVLRKRSDERPGWVRFEELRLQPDTRECLFKRMDGIDLAESLVPDDKLLDCPLALRPEIALSRKLTLRNRRDEGMVELRAPGDTATAALQPRMTELVFAMSERGSLRRALRRCGVESTSFSECLSGIRTLVERGYLYTLEQRADESSVSATTE